MSNAQKQKKIKALLSDLRKIDLGITNLKGLYAMRDEHVDALVKLGFRRAGINKSGEYRLVDNFAKKNVAFRTVAIPRFQVEFIPIEKKSKK